MSLIGVLARWTVGLGLLAALIPAASADGIKTERVHFKQGASSATIKGHLVGDTTIDYLLGAKSGQQMSVSLKVSNDAAYFNVLPPGSQDEAIFIGSTSGNEFAGTLSQTGDYRIRVYLMRSAARRHEKVDYTLHVAITAGSAAAASTTQVAGADASGTVPCAAAAGQPMGQCPFGVTRTGNGSATVVVTRPDGRKRTLFFENGKFLTADTSQADGNIETTASKQADLTTVHVGPERYEIPDALIYGG